MTRDRSLDEFADAGADDAESGEADEPDEDAADLDPGDRKGESDDDRCEATPGSGDEASPTDGDDGPPPATPSYGWTPDPVPCTRCNRRVNRRWRDRETGAPVCRDCKEW